MKGWHWVLLCVVCISLGATLILPIFDKRFDVLNIYSADKEIQPIADEDVKAYHYWYAPEDSFGISSFKEVNWSHFKKLFNEHTNWLLEYKRYSYSEWTNGNQYLTINKTWNESGFWKFNLILDVPVNVYSARFTFGCDLQVLDYVEREGYEIWLNYSANMTEIYSMKFNWSDIASIPGIIITHGKTDNLFWFRFRRDNIPAGHYEFDPTFGDATFGASAGIYSIKNVIVGSEFTMGANSGTADNITARVLFYDTFTNKDTKAVIYESDGDYVDETDMKEISGNSWTYYSFTWDFSAPKPTLLANTKYYLCLFGENVNPDGGISSESNVGYFINGSSESWATCPDPISFETSVSGKNAQIYCSYTETPSESWHEVNNWNGSLYVSPSWQQDSEWNGSLYVPTTWHTINEWNGSLYVSPSWKQDSDWNGSLYVKPSWQQDSEWNGSLYVPTIWNAEKEWNGSLYTPTTWHTMNEWNGSLYVYGYFQNITISNPYPPNSSTNIKMNITLAITVESSSGYNMNITWYWGNSSANATHYLGSTLNVTNGTYWMHMHPANHTFTTYWWSVNVSDGNGNYANETYKFNTSVNASMIMSNNRDRFVLGLILGSMMFLMIGMVLWKRKRK